MDTNEFYFTALSYELEVEMKHLPLLFSALQTDTNRIFPMLKTAILLNDFEIMYDHTDALKGIIGNMHLYDVYEKITRMDCAAKAKDEAFFYEETLSIIQIEIELIIKNFYIYLHE